MMSSNTYYLNSDSIEVEKLKCFLRHSALNFTLHCIILYVVT